MSLVFSIMSTILIFFCPCGGSKSRSMLARDLQSVILYDKEGKFAGVRRPNSNLPIEIDGTKIVIADAIGSSGLDLKVSKMNPHSATIIFIFCLQWPLCVNHGLMQTDPGVPVVYAGFGALMLTTCISYLSHTQVNIPAKR